MDDKTVNQVLQILESELEEAKNSKDDWLFKPYPLLLTRQEKQYMLLQILSED